MNAVTQNTAIIDSLKQVINTTKEDTNRIDAYIEWGTELYMQNPDTAIVLWKEAQDLAEKQLLKNLSVEVEKTTLTHLSTSLNNIGFVYNIQGNKSEALKFYGLSVEISERIGDKEGVAITYDNMGIIHSNSGDNSEAMDFYNKSLEIREEIQDTHGIIFSLNNIGYFHMNQGNVSEAIKLFNKSFELSNEIKDNNTISLILNNLANIYYDQGDVTKALDYYTKSLHVREEIGDNKGIAHCLNNISLVYHEQGDIEKAKEYYMKAIDFFGIVGDKRGIATGLNNIGVIYSDEATMSQGRENNSKKDSLLNIALGYYLKALVIREEIGDKDGIAKSLNSIGRNYLEQSYCNEEIEDSLLNEANQRLKRALKLARETGNKSIMSLVLSNLALTGKKKDDKAMFTKYAKECYQLSKELGYPSDIERAALLMKEVSLIQNDYKKAYYYYTEEILMRDSIKNEKNYKETQKQQARYEYEKQAAVDSIAHVKEIELKDMDIARIEEEKKAQAAQRNMFIVGFVLVLVLAVYIFRSYRQKKKANILLAERNEEIMQQKEEIITQNDHILQQKEEIESQRDIVISQKEHIEMIHHEVSQSIDYATRLQSSILSEESVLGENTSDHFVLFKPKDKVSGDFYWWARVEDHLIVTAADCTGHGVPGAFMSMLGVSFLREIVLKEYITHPGVILRKLRKEIIKTLKQKGDIGSQKDGMDMALISIDLQTNLCQFAGANNPLYLIMSEFDNDRVNDFENNSLVEIKGDKMPIAIYEKMDPYTTHEIQLSSGDLLYMFSDGFADQFGGPKGKKYKYKPFKQLLTDNSSKSLSEQKELLDNAFISWKGDYEQIDDVVVIGIKI